MALYISMAALSIALWFGLTNELTNFIALGMMLIVGLVSSIMIFKGNSRFTWSVVAIFSLLSVAAMVMAMSSVRRETDGLATSFISQHICRPEINELRVDPTWKVNPQYAEKIVERFGAARRMTYQGNGLLRYGFLHDKDRTVWMPACK